MDITIRWRSWDMTSLDIRLTIMEGGRNKKGKTKLSLTGDGRRPSIIGIVVTERATNKSSSFGGKSFNVIDSSGGHVRFIILTMS